MKKIIVFGATGSLGVYLTDYLQNDLPSGQYEVIAAGRRKTSYFERLNIRYYSMDIRDKSQFDQLPTEDVFAVVHLANMLPARMTDDDPYTYFNVNLLGSINILEYMKKVDAKRIIFTQTYADVAGFWGNELVLKSDLPRSLKFTGDHALYTISKCAVQDLISYYHAEFGMDNFILRLPNVYLYSPETYYFVNGEKRLISYRYMIQRAIKGEPIEVWGDPNRTRDMVYVKDFCQLVCRTITTDRTTGLYNVGSGVGTTLQEQIEGIVEVFSPRDAKSEIILCPEKPSAMEYIMDIENARQELGYEPQYFYKDYLLDYKKEMKADRFLGL